MTLHGAPRVQVHHDLAEVAELWQALGGQLTNPFATWEFNELWWRHFGASRPLHLIVSRCPRGHSAILPLYQARSTPLRVLRFLGHTAGDLPGPVRGAEGHEAVQQALRALPRRTATTGPRLGDVLLAEQLAAEPGWTDVLAGRQITSEPAPVLHVRGRTWEQVLAGYSRNLRQQIRRRERTLRDRHDVQLHLTRQPDQLTGDLDVLLRLHALRWGHAGAFAGRQGAFHRDFARLALERGWLRLWRLNVDGAPAAAWYGFRYAGQEWFYQSGRDPAFDHLHVGFVLMSHTLREAIGDGVSAYQFLRGGEDYKLRFADDTTELLTVLVGLSRPGRAAARVGAGLVRLPKSLQAPLRGVIQG